MPPFTAKEILRFLIWIAVLLIAALAIIWMILRSPGRKSVPTKGTTAMLHGSFHSPSAPTSVVTVAEA